LIFNITSSPFQLLGDFIIHQSILPFRHRSSKGLSIFTKLGQTKFGSVSI
jgi:hypothetical protein